MICTIRVAALATLVSAAFVLPAHAQVTVKDPWVRATVSQQKATGAFMQITSAQDARLVEAKSPVAGVVEIHEMAMEKDVMRMRALPNGLDLPAGKTVELKSGGYHVMLMDLKQQMKEGDTVSMTLVVEGKDKKRSTIEVKAPVKPLAAAAPKMDHSQHKH
jgi:copper(I)-binding protein